MSRPCTPCMIAKCMAAFVAVVCLVMISVSIIVEVSSK